MQVILAISRPKIPHSDAVIEAPDFIAAVLDRADRERHGSEGHKRSDAWAKYVLHVRAPARISRLGPPQHCTQPQPEVTINLWPSGWVCQTVRAPGSNVTSAPDTRDGSTVGNSGSICADYANEAAAARRAALLANHSGRVRDSLSDAGMPQGPAASSQPQASSSAKSRNARTR